MKRVRLVQQMFMMNSVKVQDHFNQMFSYNTDTSKYSPSFIMKAFAYMLLAMDLPKNIWQGAATHLAGFAPVRR